MNRIAGVLLLALLVALPSFAGDKKSAAKTVTLHGYVVDGMCSKRMAKSGAAMEKAANHTKDCLLEDGCAASGYGIFSEGKYYKFDAAGSKEAHAMIEKSSRDKGMLFDVTGTMKGQTFAVTSIKESSATDTKMEKKEGEKD